MSLLRLIWIMLLPLNLQAINPVRYTASGAVRGSWHVSSDGRIFMAFTGIPFAKPPLGNLRFANPEPVDPWTKTLDATKEKPRCAQRNYLFSEKPVNEGSEDCLYLNIYVPVDTTPMEECSYCTRPARKVMAAIHWGGFFAGGSDSGYLGPQYFMNYNAILVTFNYRLGIFGFLSTLDDAAPGNFGLKDQVMALKWIKENIGNFGGNPFEITIFGQSAGAASVHFHLVSPTSIGLFARAISQSGSALAAWAEPNNALRLMVTKNQALMVNCQNSYSNYLLIECMRKVSSDVLLQSQDLFKVFHRFPFTLWGTVIETATARNPNPFITQEVTEYLKTGNFRNVPWMTGLVQNEGLLIAASLMTVDSERDDLNKDFNATMIKLLGLDAINTDVQSAYKKIFDFYLGADHLNISDSKQVQGFIDVWSDRYFTYPLYQSLNLQLFFSHKSIYLYSFEYSGGYTYADDFSTRGHNYIHNMRLGPSHCDDLLYQFSSELANITEPHDLALSRIWLGMWTNFAIYGDPNPPESRILYNVDWKPLSTICEDTRTLPFLKVNGSQVTGPQFSISQGFYPNRIALWDGIINKG